MYAKSPFVAALVALTSHAVFAQGTSNSAVLPDSYAVKGNSLSYFNTPNRRHTILDGGSPLSIGRVEMDLQRQAEVLVQFTSGITTVTPDGCPCSVRFSLKVDDQEPVVIKRINIGTGTRTVAGAYQPDRQSADGSFVFSLPPGSHEFSLIAQRVDGESKALYAFYQNIQVIKFDRP